MMKLLLIGAALTTFAAVSPAGAQTTPAASAAPAATPATAAPADGAKFSLDTPIQEIVADERGKVVMEKNFPGMTALPEYEMFKALSLHQVQPYSNGKLTDEILAKAATDLAAIK